MANAADVFRVHFRQALEQVHPAQVVPDTLHGAADIALFIEPLPRLHVVPEARVVRRQRHVSPLGKFRRVISVRFLALSRHDPLAQGRGGMQAQHGRARADGVLGQKQERRHRTARIRLVADGLARVRGELIRFEQFISGRLGAVSLRQRPHDLLHILHDVGPATGPLFACFNGRALSRCIHAIQEIRLVGIEGCGVPQARGHNTQH